MIVVAKVIIGIVALIHIYILWVEMCAWTTTGRKVFRNFPKNLFVSTKQMAANQGLYNGFLATGLIWSFFIDSPQWSVNIALYFLCCVTVAGIYGAISLSKKIFIVQSIPALIGVIFWSIVKFS